MKKKVLLFSMAFMLVISSVIAGCAAPTPSPTEPAPPVEVPEEEIFEWDYQVLVPAGDPSYAVFGRFADRVRRASDGRLDITVHPAGALVGVFEMFDAVSEGLFEMFFANPIYWSGKDAGFAALSDHPVTFDQAWQLESWYWHGGGAELWRELYADYNMYPIPVVAISIGSMHSTVKVSSVADLEGLSIRAPHGMMADVLTKAGAAVTVIPSPEIYTALEKGVVQAAQFGNPSWHYGFGWHEVTDYILYPWPVFQTTGADVVVNMDAWQALPDDLKQILESEAIVFSRDWLQFASVSDFDALGKMVEYGNEIVRLPDEEIVKLRALSMEVMDEWATKSPKAAEIIESKRAHMKRIGIIE